MVDVPESISCLSNEQLRKKLIECGIAPAPLTPTTRRLFQRKLAKRLNQSNLTPKNIFPSSEKEPCPPDEVAKNLNVSPKKEVIFHETDANAKEYFAIQECGIQGPHLFTDKKIALKFLTEHKKGRLQSFSNREEAEKFSLSQFSEDVDKENQKKPEVSEKSNQFKTPKQTELNALCKLIEGGNIDGVSSLVWENPRYLISSSDGPVIIKPGTRYNALHLASRTNHPRMIEVILNVLRDDDFQKLMYESDSPGGSVQASRVSHIIDLYLNTPDKILCETPLHFACKLGYPDVVKVLVANPLCSKVPRNKSGQTPEEVVCSRQGSESDKLKIKEILKDQFYIPLLRCHDNSDAPVVACPWTPNSKNQGSFVFPTCDPLDPIQVVSAMAGPMSASDAQKLHHSWMSPNRKALEGKRMMHIRRSDMDRGDERIGRELARKLDVPWMEYWDFLQTFADFSTKLGLEKLEEFIERRFNDQFGLEHDDSSVFEDSLNDLCSNLNDMKVTEGQNEAEKNQTIPKPLKTDTWWSTMSSSPSRRRLMTSQSNFVDFQQEVVKENLLKIRKEQLEKFDTNFQGHLSPRKHHLSSWEQEFGDSSIPGTPLNKKGGFKCETLNGMSTPDQLQPSKHIFLSGTSPSKLDTDVVLAIGETEVRREIFPFTWKWLRSVLSYSEEDRRKWKTPTPKKAPNRFVRHTPIKSPWPASPLAKPQFKIKEPFKNKLDNEFG